MLADWLSTGARCRRSTVLGVRAGTTGATRGVAASRPGQSTGARAREAAAPPGRSYTEPWSPVRTPDSHGGPKRAHVFARAGRSIEPLDGSQRVKHSSRSRARWGVLTAQLLAPILRSNGQRQHQWQRPRPASKAMGAKTSSPVLPSKSPGRSKHNAC